jgi:hypothetical protein
MLWGYARFPPCVLPLESVCARADSGGIETTSEIAASEINQNFKTMFSWNRPLIGLRWYLVPVGLNVLLFLTQPATFDHGAFDAVILFFSIPYWAIAAIIGLRRARNIKVLDFLYLVSGNILMYALVCYAYPLIRSAVR